MTERGIVAVARRAGVAPSSVSRYANSPDRVSPELAGRIQKAMDELDYRPNPHARALRTHKPETVWIVFVEAREGRPVVGVFRRQADALDHSRVQEDATVIEVPLA